MGDVMRTVRLALAAGLCAFVMMVCTPLAAIADEPAGSAAKGAVGIADQGVAEVNGVSYPTFEDALAAAKSGDTIIMLDDVSYTRQDISGKDLTIDLNGCTIQSNRFGFTIENGTLTLDDTSAEEDGLLKVVNGGVTEVGVVLQEGGHFVMNGGTIDSFEYGVFANPKNKNTATVNAGHIKGQWGIAASGNKVPGCTEIAVKNGVVEGLDAGISINGSSNNGGVKIAVSGGEIKGTGEKSAGMYLPGCDGETVITGGTITGATGIELRAGSLSVSGDAVISGTGAFVTMPNDNGATTTGVGIAVAQHGTKQPIDLTISGDVRISGYYAFYEWNPQGNSDEDLSQIELSIEGGSFESTGADALSSLYSADFTGFVSGGSYNKALSAEHLAPGVTIVENADGTFGTHQHVLKKVGAKAATCTQDGNSEYWVCSECGALFKDEAMTDEVDYDDVVVKATGHGVENAILHKGKDATTKAEGTVEHWECPACGGLFLDAGLTKAVAAEDVVIPKLDKGQSDESKADGGALPATGDGTLLPIAVVIVAAAIIAVFARSRKFD